MECLGVEPRVAWWKAQTNPLSYGGTPIDAIIGLSNLSRQLWDRKFKVNKIYFINVQETWQMSALHLQILMEHAPAGCVVDDWK